MRKMSKLLILLILIVVVAVMLLIMRHKKKTEEVFILDGPGSYVVRVSGTVTDISDETEKGYILTMQLDNTAAAEFGEEAIRVQMEYDSEYTPEQKFIIGDHITVSFAGGMHWEGSPKLITGIYDASLADSEATSVITE